MIAERFLTRVKWISFEQLTYQAILIGHELLLWKKASATTFGVIGTVLALSYLSAALLNFGFDTSIAPFFSAATKDRRSCLTLFLTPMALQLLLLIVLPPLAYVLFGNSLYVAQKIELIGYGNLVLCWLLAITESVKRSFRIFLHAAFLNKETALIEAGTILLFVALVWGTYFSSGHLSLRTVLISLVISSAISNARLFSIWHSWYKRLPAKVGDESANLIKRILVSRFFGYLHQVNRQLFSTNTIIPSFALLFGAKEAGTLTLLSTLSHFIRAIQKTVSISQEATIAEGKDFVSDKKQELFNRTAATSYYALNLTALLLFLVTPPILFLSKNSLPSKLIFLYFVFMFSENFFSIYEKFFITEEKTHIFLLCNTTMLIATTLTMKYFFPYPPTTSFVLIILIRFMGFIGIRQFSRYRWGIKTDISNSLINMSYPLITSLSFIYAMI
jgi:hypothetical protein